MNLPRVYTCSPSWTPLPPLSPYHPSGSSQCTSPKHPVSCIRPGLAIHFLCDIIHVSVPFSQIIPPSPSPTESKRRFYTSNMDAFKEVLLICRYGMTGLNGWGSADRLGSWAFRSVSDLWESSHHSQCAEGFDSVKEAREVVLAAAVPFLDLWWRLPAEAGRQWVFSEIALRLWGLSVNWGCKQGFGSGFGLRLFGDWCRMSSVGAWSDYWCVLTQGPSGRVGLGCFRDDLKSLWVRNSL